MSRPTPETSAAIIAADGAWTFALKDKMQSLERQRDEARELARELRDALAEMVEANDGVAVMPTQEARQQNAALKQAKKSLTKAKEVLP